MRSSNSRQRRVGGGRAPRLKEASNVSKKKKKKLPRQVWCGVRDDLVAGHGIPFVWIHRSSSPIVISSFRSVVAVSRSPKPALHAMTVDRTGRGSRRPQAFFWSRCHANCHAMPVAVGQNIPPVLCAPIALNTARSERGSPVWLCACV